MRSRIEDIASSEHPVRGFALVEESIKASRDEVLKAIKERRVVILDVSELLLLHSRGLLRKEDILEIIREGLYMPRGKGELRKLVDAGVIDERELEELLDYIRSLF